MQVMDTPMTSRIETPNRIPVITSSEKSWLPLATGELVIGITMPLGSGVVVGIKLSINDRVLVDELCVKLWVFIDDDSMVVGDPMVRLVDIVEEGHVKLLFTLLTQCTKNVVELHEGSFWVPKS